MYVRTCEIRVYFVFVGDQTFEVMYNVCTCVYISKLAIRVYQGKSSLL